jgi:site-specific DNA recombinase
MTSATARGLAKGAATPCVIYCRVSSTKQTTAGDGLQSQETRCREFARMKGYDVATVFKDDVSGSLIQRPAMKAMLAFIKKNKRGAMVVVIDDVSRLARGLEAHLELRSAIASAGATLESPAIEFGEDSDSRLVEHLLASVSQHQRQKNAEQTKNRMRARMMNGYWVFQAPVGYKFESVRGRGQMLVREEPIASVGEPGRSHALLARQSAFSKRSHRHCASSTRGRAARSAHLCRIYSVRRLGHFTAPRSA